MPLGDGSASADRRYLLAVYAVPPQLAALAEAVQDAYSRYGELYRWWERKLSVTIRQAHVGGEKLFVDYAGDTVPVIVDRLTGETRAAQIFVTVMWASNFTHAEATWTQGLAD